MKKKIKKQKSAKSEIPDNIWPGTFYKYPLKSSDLKDTDSERKDDEKEDGEIIL